MARCDELMLPVSHSTTVMTEPIERAASNLPGPPVGKIRASVVHPASDSSPWNAILMGTTPLPR
jgi:hypothetical protein